MSKIYLIVLGLLFAWNSSRGQVGYNYKQFGISFEAGVERAYTNIPKENSNLFTDVKFIYNYSPYIPISAELQFGTFSGGGLKPSDDSLGRAYPNHYESLIFHGDLQLGEVIDYQDSQFMSFLKNFYVGTGVGLMFTSNTVQRTSIYDPQYVFPGRNSSVNLVIPLRTGYEIKFYNEYEEPFFALNTGFNYNIVMGYSLSGYDDYISKNMHTRQDGYIQFTIGCKFYFGNTVGYNKIIRHLKSRK